jgi:hypothetical protein
MDEIKDQQSSGEIDPKADLQLEDKCPDQLRREFLKRFGQYTAGAAVGMFVLMSATTSAVAGSDGGPMAPQPQGARETYF